MASRGNQSIRVTHLLHAARDGQTDAAAILMQRVYTELKEIAGSYMRRERQNRTMSTTDLVHEAYFKLIDGKQVSWEDRGHFFGSAGRAMRQVLVDYARARNAQKRGGDWQRTTLTGEDPGFSVSMGDLLNLDDSLSRLDKRNPRLRQVIEMRFFGGMTEEEVSVALDVTPRTVQRN